MDSTTVALITKAATQLGMTARNAFIWWVIAKNIGGIIGWCFVTAIVYRITWMIVSLVKSNWLALRILKIAQGRGENPIFPSEWVKIEQWISKHEADESAPSSTGRAARS